MLHRGRNHTQCLSIFLCLIALFPLASCVMPQEPISGAPYAGSRTAGIQKKNITPAISDVNIRDSAQEESAKSLARKLETDPLGQYGYYNNNMPQAAADPASPQQTMLSQSKDAPPRSFTQQGVATPPTPEKDMEEAQATALDKEPIARVALMLPITGEATSVARSLQNAAELAATKASENNQPITIIPLDTRGTESGAKLAMEKAAAEAVDLIIGPMFNNTTMAIAPMASKHNIPVVSLSNDISLAEEEIYVFGFNPREQVQRVVEYAYSQGLREFSLLAPDNTFGDTIAEEVEETLKRRNIRARRAELYESLDEDLSRSIQRLTFLDPSLPPPKPKSEALIIPEGSRNLLTLIARLYRRGVQNEHLQLLGTKAWDNDVVIGEPRLSGSWFATTSPLKQDEFTAIFRKRFGYEPLQVTSLGYDAVMFAVSVAQKGGEDPFTHEHMTEPAGFQGVDNLFRFNRDRIAERTLAVVEIQNGRLEVLDPAPTVFQAKLR